MVIKKINREELRVLAGRAISQSIDWGNLAYVLDAQDECVLRSHALSASYALQAFAEDIAKKGELGG